MTDNQFCNCQVNDVKVDSASSPVSALDFCPDTLHLAVGDESGVVSYYNYDVLYFIIFSFKKVFNLTN